MGLGDNIGFLIDLACRKENNQVVEVQGKTLEKLVELLF